MQKGLAPWFAIAHPRYRWWLVQLFLGGTAGSALAYLDNYLLSALTDVLSVAMDGGEALRAEVSPWLTQLAELLPLPLPLVVLAVFVLARLLFAAVTFWRTRVAGTLEIESRNDLESEILVHLLRKDDSFFTSHSPAETVNRLAVDIDRVSQRRSSVMSLWWSSLLIVGSLAFFFDRDWRLALVGLACCTAGALWTYRITRNVSSYDSDFLTHDDRVKAQFEDFLKAAPEIQVGHLYGTARARFEHRQAGRSLIYGKYASLRATLGVANVIALLLAFVTMIGVLMWLSQGGQGRATLVMLPAVIWALPTLFTHASELIYLNLDFQLARTSVGRLLEYETPGSDVVPLRNGATEPTGAAEPLSLSSVTYQYTGSDGGRQGGVVNISTVFEPGQWSAIVGGAGSGKSTLLKLLLGRYRPQEGTIRYGDTGLDQLQGARLATKLSLMPQSLALLDTTIRDNILFGRQSAAGAATQELSAEDMAVVEGIGLGRVCRLKALDMHPGEGPEGNGLEAQIGEARAHLRQALQERCGVHVAPYEQDGLDPKHWLLESLLRGRADRARVVKALLGRKNDGAPLQPLVDTELGRRLAPLGARVLQESQHLLRLPSYAQFSELTAVAVDEPVWRLRAAQVPGVDGESPPPEAARVLLAIALTSAPIECNAQEEAEQVVESLRASQQPALEKLGQLVQSALRPFTLNRVHPYLSWRENLLFGAVAIPNSRTGRRVDQMVLETVEGDGLRETFTRIGLEAPVGRQGGNLSGGQGQLVALCRTLLRRTPLVALDEPTSALDPASRTAVAAFLSRWKAGRIVITISHDPAFVRHADAIRLMEGGRLVASGSFGTLHEQSQAFQTIMRAS